MVRDTYMPILEFKFKLRHGNQQPGALARDHDNPEQRVAHDHNLDTEHAPATTGECVQS
jgi:hypothetical protein